MWVIERTDQGGGYLNQPNSRSSWTRSLENARKFPTQEAARLECCPENERPVNVLDRIRN